MGFDPPLTKGGGRLLPAQPLADACCYSALLLLLKFGSWSRQEAEPVPLLRASEEASYPFIFWTEARPELSVKTKYKAGMR